MEEAKDKAVLLEVKQDREYLPSHQALHLSDEAACQELEADLHVHLAGMVVIYRGENMSCTKGISYWNGNTYMGRIVKLSATPLRNRLHMMFCSQSTS